MENEKLMQLHGQIKLLEEEVFAIRRKLLKLQLPREVIVHLEYAGHALINAEFALEDSREVHNEQNNSCLRATSRR